MLTVPGVSEAASCRGRPALAGRVEAPEQPPLAKERLDRPARARRSAPARQAGGRPRASRGELPGLAAAGQRDGQALKPGVSGRIIYKEPPPPPAASRRSADAASGHAFVSRPQPAQPAGVGGMVMQVRRRHSPKARPRRHRSTEERRSLYLRDGDVIPSIITKIDERGVWFKTSLSTSTFVAHDKVKAVELAPEPPSAPTAIRLTRSKQDGCSRLPQDAEGRPAHALDPFQKRRLPPRARVEDGRQDARGRGPARKQGDPARPDLPDHLAARRRARSVQEAGPTRSDGRSTRVQACEMTASG